MWFNSYSTLSATRIPTEPVMVCWVFLLIFTRKLFWAPSLNFSFLLSSIENISFIYYNNYYDYTKTTKD